MVSSCNIKKVYRMRL